MSKLRSTDYCKDLVSAALINAGVELPTKDNAGFTRANLEKGAPTPVPEMK